MPFTTFLQEDISVDPQSVAILPVEERTLRTLNFVIATPTVLTIHTVIGSFTERLTYSYVGKYITSLFICISLRGGE